MSKDIIKNCPAFLDDVQLLEFSAGTCNSLQNHRKHCQDCIDCVLKQIVELYKFQQQEFDEEIKNGNYPDKYKFFKSGRADAGTEILQLLDIEECEK